LGLDEVNSKCWGSVFSRTELLKDNIPFKNVAWNVNLIKDRRVKKSRVEYLLEWKNLNGRIFNYYKIKNIKNKNKFVFII
jgi:hypothetical protein